MAFPAYGHFEMRSRQHIAGQALMEAVMRVAALVLMGVLGVVSEGIARADAGSPGPKYPNLGFEEWFANWDCYRSYVDYPTFGCDSIQIATDYVFSGVRSLRARRCWWDTAFSNMERGALTNKKYIEVTWYERSVSAASCSDSSTGSADLSFFNRSGEYLQWSWSFSNGEVAVRDWIYHRVKVAVPEGARYAEFAIFPAITGDYYLDEVGVQQTDDPVGCFNPIDNSRCK